jgi:glutathione synthase/RimK-type ligase-like ATP-grasp enzyme
MNRVLSTQTVKNVFKTVYNYFNNRGSMILSNKKTRKSARVLQAELEQKNYTGTINFGNSRLNRYYENVLNKPEAVGNTVNKLNALRLFDAYGLNTTLITEDEARTAVLSGSTVIGRKTYHTKGYGMYMCYTLAGIRRAKRLGSSHFLKYISNAREFRVHIVNGQSIKLSEKFAPPGVIKRNHRHGTIFSYPYDFNHKKTLRRVAKEAVECLGLDFGAVDILYKDDTYYILEVNSAPCLTDTNSDTLERYVTAFTQPNL